MYCNNNKLKSYDRKFIPTNATINAHRYSAIKVRILFLIPFRTTRWFKRVKLERVVPVSETLKTLNRLRYANCWLLHLFSGKHLEPDFHKSSCLKFSVCAHTNMVTPLAGALTQSRLPVIEIFRTIMVTANPYAGKNDDKSVLKRKKKKMQLISRKTAPRRL